VTTRFNVSELWVGVEASRNREAVEGILSPLVVLDFDESAARVFGRITAHLAAAGNPRGDMDVLIASVALVHGERIVTRNARRFEGIAGVAVEVY
jgi:tRNA(fMet)-specific endonuclease VapC